METREVIEDLLERNPGGLTIQELSNISHISRYVIERIIAELLGEGKIFIRKIGKAKLIYWSEYAKTNS